MRNFVITVNGKSYSVAVEEVGGAPVVSAPVVPVAAPVATPVAAPAPVAAPVAAPAPKAATPANGEKVLSPFPGLIKNLLVAEGATVKKDQPILVLEAMKNNFQEITQRLPPLRRTLRTLLRLQLRARTLRTHQENRHNQEQPLLCTS